MKGDNWTQEDNTPSYRKKAVETLEKIKEERKGKRFKLVRDYSFNCLTYREIEENEVGK